MIQVWTFLEMFFEAFISNLPDWPFENPKWRPFFKMAAILHKHSAFWRHSKLFGTAEKKMKTRTINGTFWLYPIRYGTSENILKTRTLNGAFWWHLKKQMETAEKKWKQGRYIVHPDVILYLRSTTFRGCAPRHLERNVSSINKKKTHSKCYDVE